MCGAFLEEVLRMKKYLEDRGKWFLAAGVVLLVIGALHPMELTVFFARFPHLQKVVDSSDARFDPNKFMFEDYKSRQELHAVLSSILELGTDMKTIDKVFIDGVGAKKIESTDSSLIEYHYRPWYRAIYEWQTLSNFDGWSIYVTSKNGQLIKYHHALHN